MKMKKKKKKISVFEDALFGSRLKWEILIPRLVVYIPNILVIKKKGANYNFGS